MELLETQDPDKKRLIESSERHKRAMEKELGDLSIKSDKVINNALIIGGSLALTFLVISAIGQGRKKKKRKLAKATPTAVGATGEPIVPTPEEEDEDDEPSVLNKVGTQLLNQASLILLDLARQKLNEYLLSRKNTDDHS